MSKVPYAVWPEEDASDLTVVEVVPVWSEDATVEEAAEAWCQEHDEQRSADESAFHNAAFDSIVVVVQRNDVERRVRVTRSWRAEYSTELLDVDAGEATR